MKKIVVILTIMVCISRMVFTQPDYSFKQFGNTAEQPLKKQWRYSLFSNAEYGISDKVSLRAHPVWFFVAPSAEVKWQWMGSEKRNIAFVHGITCPTPVMNIFAMSGTGGLISPEFKIPVMFSIKNGIISTWRLNDRHKITAEALIKFAVLNSKLQPGSSIDLPVISPRNAVYYKNVGLEAALTNEGVFTGRFDYYSRLQAYLFPAGKKIYKEEYGSTSRFFGEYTAMVGWNISDKFKLGAGGRLCYGEYPFGTQWHLLPMLDFVRYVR